MTTYIKIDYFSSVVTTDVCICSLEKHSWAQTMQKSLWPTEVNKMLLSSRICYQWMRFCMLINHKKEQVKCIKTIKDTQEGSVHI